MDINEEIVEKIKQETDICDTSCCYETCRQCVTKYMESKENKKKEKIEMNKSNLKNKMVVELRNGFRYLVIDDFLMGEYGSMELSSYNNDLLCCNYSTYNSGYDIVKIFNTEGCTFDTIFTSINLTLIWEREEVINWNEVEMGTIILVKDWEESDWEERKFITYVEEIEYPFITYRDDRQGTVSWKYAKLK